MKSPKKSAMSELSQHTKMPGTLPVKKVKKAEKKPITKKAIINIASITAVTVLIISTVVIVSANYNSKNTDDEVISADYTIGIEGEGTDSIDVKSEKADYTTSKHKVSLVFYDKEDVLCFTKTKTLGSLMDELGIVLSDNERMKYDLETEISEDTVFNIDNVTYGTDTGSETIDYETEYVDVQSIPYGQTQVYQEGAYGIRTIEYSVTYVNGEEVSREKSGEYISQYPTNCIIYRGVGGTVYVDGIYYPYSYTLSCESTVYTVYHGTASTSYGIPADENVIAVDPSVIPLGSKVYIEGVGIRIAADVGSAIVGNIIDIYFDYDNPLFSSWGRRPVTVYVLQ